ncbi:hypothetical protein EB796_008964 [Bugula neritina]|uniref:Uncharacterized protein n=1 Tax=Bugula neritina TaxID=10212 RepID=A0A7J7K583_BUGNE|nr:hypothetical protein EB796_008964 [Bugula neritina]
MAEGGALRPPSNFLLANSSQNPSDASSNPVDYSGAQGQELFRTFDLSEENKKKIAEVKGAFSRYFAPKIKEEFERRFNTREVYSYLPTFEATRQYLNDFNASSIDAGFKAHAVNDQVEAKYNHQSSRPTQHPRSTVQATSKPITNCKYCAGTHQPRKCPAYDKQCNNSGRKGHYAKCHMVNIFCNREMVGLNEFKV